LAMTVQAVLRGGIHRPLALVPIYLGYEHVMEIGTYMKELRGANKEKESAWQVLGAIRKLRNFGHGYVNFGTPLLLQPFLQQHAPQWREALGREEGFKPSWLTPSVNLLAEQLMTEVNNAAAINAMNLVALVLLATPHNQLSRQALERQLQLLLLLAKEAPYHANVSLPDAEPSALVDHILAMEKIQQRHDHAGALIYSSEHDAIQLSYYRNNILHLYISPALLAASLLHQPQPSVASVRQLMHSLYPLLQGELFLGWSTSELDRQLDQLLLLFSQQGLILQQGEQLQPAEADHLERGTLALLARIALETLLRLGVVLTQLRYAPSKGRAELEQQSQVVALRLAEMHSIHAPEFLDRKVFASLIHGLRSEGYFDNEDGDSARLISLQQQVMDLLPAEMANTVLEVCASDAPLP
jgi:glycerol-3-phosphate O-acyltransferase